MRGYPTIQICDPTRWHTVFFDFWVMLIVFSLSGHDTDTYRTVAYGHGAFELCLPSLGNHYQITSVRLQNIHRTPKTNESWGPGLVGHLAVW